MRIDPKIVNDAIRVLETNPTAAELDYLVTLYSTMGYYAAVAEGMSQDAEAVRKLEEANAFLDARNADPKAPMALIEAIATKQAHELRLAENKSRTNAKKLSNLQDSLREAINAIKFIGRNDSGVRIG